MVHVSRLLWSCLPPNALISKHPTVTFPSCAGQGDEFHALRPGIPSLTMLQLIRLPHLLPPRCRARAMSSMLCPSPTFSPSNQH